MKGNKEILEISNMFVVKVAQQTRHHFIKAWFVHAVKAWYCATIIQIMVMIRNKLAASSLTLTKSINHNLKAQL